MDKNDDEEFYGINKKLYTKYNIHHLGNKKKNLCSKSNSSFIQHH